MWKIFAGLCIRRPAVISSQLTPLQCRMQELYAEMDVQQSHLSAHEVRHRNDLERMAQMAREQQDGGQTNRRRQTSADIPASLLTAKELELTWEAGEKAFWKELQTGFNTAASQGGQQNGTEITSTATAWRKLDRSLVLLTRNRLGTSFDWGLPLVEITGTATLRSAAEDLVNALLPPEAHCFIVGNAPVGLHKYAYRIDEGKDQGKKQGVQIYFLKAYVDRLWHGKNVQVEAEAEAGAADSQKCEANFAWASVEEMGNFIIDKRFVRRLQTFIVDY